jgi:hypothetical protein
LAKERIKGVASDKTVGIPFVVGKEVILSHLRLEHLNKRKTCRGCCQSKNLMYEPLPSRTKEFHAMSRQKLTVAVGLFVDHTTLSAHMFKLGLKQQQD